MNKKTRVLYEMLLIGIFALWVSSIGLLISKIGVSVTKYFVSLLGCMLIACLIDYLSKLKKNDEKFPGRLPALAIVSCLLYLGYLGFWLGRFIARSLF